MKAPSKMPRNRLLLCAMLLSATLPLSPILMLTGCGTTPQTRQAQAYKTLKSVQVAVDAAMKVYGTAVVTGKVNAEKQAVIDAKHGQYRSAFRVAVQAARNDLAAIPPADLQFLADELQILISDL